MVSKKKREASAISLTLEPNAHILSNNYDFTNNVQAEESVEEEQEDKQEEIDYNIIYEKKSEKKNIFYFIKSLLKKYWTKERIKMVS